MSDPSFIARRKILQALLPIAAFEGWTAKSLREAVKATDLPHGADALYFPEGPKEVIAFWSEQMDRQAAKQLGAMDMAQMKIRDKVTAGVLARFEAIGPHQEAARRALARLTLPDSLGQGPAQLWAAADTIWRAIGDKSTDGNYYSKRATLSAVIASSLAAWLGDDSLDKAKARKFLDARIANVMQFEKAKWDFKTKTKDWPKPAEILGQLRYGRPPGRSRRSSRRARARY